MCKITGTSYLRVDLWLRRRSRFRRCTQCHPEQWHLMILWFLQTRSVDDKNKMTADIVTWLTYRTLRRLTVSVRGTILACTVTVWPDIPEQMWCWRQSVSTDHPVHSQPPAGSADLQPASTPSAPQCPLQAWKKQQKKCVYEKKTGSALFLDAEHVGTTNWEHIWWRKHRWFRTLILTWVLLVGPEFQAGALGRGQVRAHQVSPLQCRRPVAAWKEQEVTLRKRQGSLVYTLLHIRDETRS